MNGLHPILVTDVFAFIDVLVRFWGQKVESPGHSRQRHNCRQQLVIFIQLFCWFVYLQTVERSVTALLKVKLGGCLTTDIDFKQSMNHVTDFLLWLWLHIVISCLTCKKHLHAMFISLMRCMLIMYVFMYTVSPKNVHFLFFK